MTKYPPTNNIVVASCTLYRCVAAARFEKPALLWLVRRALLCVELSWCSECSECSECSDCAAHTKQQAGWCSESHHLPQFEQGKTGPQPSKCWIILKTPSSANIFQSINGRDLFQSNLQPPCRLIASQKCAITTTVT